MTTVQEDHDTSTTNQPGTDPGTTTTQEEAKKRFAVASFIQRTASRSKKRAIMMGKATGRGVANAGRASWGQIVEPYSGLKLMGVAVISMASLIGMWYLAFMAMVTVLVATGSVILGILACAVAYVLLARFVIVPLINAAAGYYTRAQQYRMQPKGMRTVQVRPRQTSAWA